MTESCGIDQDVAGKSSATSGIALQRKGEGSRRHRARISRLNVVEKLNKFADCVYHGPVFLQL